MFYDVFRGYRNGTLGENGLKNTEIIRPKRKMNLEIYININQKQTNKRNTGEKITDKEITIAK